MTAVYGALIAMALLLLLFGALVVGLLRSNAEVLRQLDKLGVRIGDDQHAADKVGFRPSHTGQANQVASITGISPSGDPVAISPLASNHPVLLAFLSTSCSSCTMFWETFDSQYKTIGGSNHRVVLVTLGADEESPTRAAALTRGKPQVVMSTLAWDEYAVPGAPYFVLIDPNTKERIGEGSASTYQSLETFIADAAGDREWDKRIRKSDRREADREDRINEELRQAGLHPDDPRFYELEQDPVMEEPNAE